VLASSFATDGEAQAWLGWHAEQHQEAFPDRIYVPPGVGEFWAWYSRARREGAKAGRGDGELRAGYLIFLADSHWAPKRAPWNGWAKQWAEFVEAAVDARPAPEAAPQVQPDTPAGRAWGRALARMREAGQTYALGWVQKLEAVDLLGRVLELRAADSFALTWFQEHYGGLLSEVLAEDGLTLSLTAPEGPTQLAGGMT